MNRPVEEIWASTAALGSPRFCSLSLLLEALVYGQGAWLFIRKSLPEAVSTPADAA